MCHFENVDRQCHFAIHHKHLLQIKRYSWIPYLLFSHQKPQFCLLTNHCNLIGFIRKDEFFLSKLKLVLSSHRKQTHLTRDDYDDLIVNSWINTYYKGIIPSLRKIRNFWKALFRTWNRYIWISWIVASLLAFLLFTSSFFSIVKSKLLSEFWNGLTTRKHNRSTIYAIIALRCTLNVQKLSIIIIFVDSLNNFPITNYIYIIFNMFCILKLHRSYWKTIYIQTIWD